MHTGLQVFTLAVKHAMICGTLVNTQTHRHTAFYRLYY